MRIDLQVHAAAPVEAVWRVLVDWERQPEWMLDAKEVIVLTEKREGVGVTIRCPTLLLGVTVQDVMRVTGWRENEYFEVTHLGNIITGKGAFELAAAPDGGTTINWWEEVDPPLGAFGRWGAQKVARPIINRIFTKSLNNLARLAEAAVAA